jgi:hypothetical protein
LGYNNFVRGGSINVVIGVNNNINATSLTNFSTVIGTDCCPNLSGGHVNVAIGRVAMPDVITGTYSTAIGSYSGTNFKYGTSNTFLGAGTGIDISNNTYNESTAVGYGARITDSYQVVLGRASETVYVPGKLTTNMGLTINGKSIFSTRTVGTTSINIPMGGCYIVMIAYSTTNNDTIGKDTASLDMGWDQKVYIATQAGGQTCYLYQIGGDFSNTNVRLVPSSNTVAVVIGSNPSNYAYHVWRNKLF